MSTFSPLIFYLAGNVWPNTGKDQSFWGLFPWVEGGEESCLSCDSMRRELNAWR